MIKSTTGIRLNQHDQTVARAHGVPITARQRRMGDYLDLQFDSREDCDTFEQMMAVALDNDALGLAPLTPVPVHLTQAAKDFYRDSPYCTPPPVPPSDRTTWVTPTDNPGAVWTGFLWLLFWGALMIGGAVTFLGWLAGIVGR